QFFRKTMSTIAARSAAPPPISIVPRRVESRFSANSMVDPPYSVSTGMHGENELKSQIPPPPEPGSAPTYFMKWPQMSPLEEPGPGNASLAGGPVVAQGPLFPSSHPVT